MPSDLVNERAGQQRWRLRPEWARVTWFDKLLCNEYLSVNVAVPLLRYDTGDLAEAVNGPCPCGRMLPAFAGLRDRYARLAFLPHGTMQHWDALELVLDLPSGHGDAVQQFQVYQFKDQSSELRLVAKTPLSAEFQRNSARSKSHVREHGV